MFSKQVFFVPILKNFQRSFSSVSIKSRIPTLFQCHLGPLASSTQCRAMKMFPYGLTNPPPQAPETKEHLEIAMKVWPQLLDDISRIPEFKEIPECLDRAREVAEYAVPNGKKWRMLHLMLYYSYNEKPENLTEENLKKCAILGWVLEFLQAMILMQDDIVDESKLRRGKTPWFRVPGVGLKAILDGLLLHHQAMFILLKYFKNDKRFADLFHHINTTNMHECSGQVYDTHFIDPLTRELKFHKYTLPIYKICVKFKSTRYSIINPIILSLCMANTNQSKIDAVLPILEEVGLMFQMQNDFKDLAINQGEVLDPKKERVLGQDIEEGKCTWFIAKALEKANSSQKKLMMENYGKPNRDAAQKIYEIYCDLKLDEDFVQHENSSFEWIKSEMKKITDPAMRKIIADSVHKHYKNRVDL